MTPKKILILDDYAPMANLFSSRLQRKGYQAQCSYYYDEALSYIMNINFDLIILDYRLDPKSEDKNGLRFLQEIRQKGQTLPVIIISGLPKWKINYSSALYAGAQYFLQKPPSPHELYSTVQAALSIDIKRQKHFQLPLIIQHNNIYIDLQKDIVRIANNPLFLPKKECLILATLLSQQGKILTYTDFAHCFGPATQLSAQKKNSLRVHITKLKKHLGTPANALQNIRNIGYIWKDNI